MRPSGPLILSYEGHQPSVAADAFIAPSAQLIGNVRIGSQSSIWYGCILRGDVNKIEIGDRTNLQDGTIVHVSPETSPTIVGSDVLVGHGALLHGCLLQDGSFVGMRAVLLNQTIVESGALVAAGSLVRESSRIRTGEIWGGTPAKKIGTLSAEMLLDMKASVQHYVELGRRHRDSALQDVPSASRDR